MKKKKIQNITIGIIAISIIGAIVAYNYSVDQTKQKGLQFGVELEQIQQEVKDLQIKFYSEKTKWEEGDITKEELLKFYDEHLNEFNEIISKYDDLDSPELFESSVELLKLSSETQLSSDSEYIKWIETGDESAKVRSDTQFQESVEYELQGLVEFYSAKTGIKNYDEDAKFEAPQTGLTQKVIQVAENMASKCDEEFKNDSGEFDSDEIEVEWFNCINEAKKWKIEHLP
ncbi:hypothetical protein AAA799E16_01147 [Marine Group I thaumarchaeote SCGC AAA799-E16]|uniref:Uncharacterized protein n=5 Tax=Marine Group I TaxID=905826 RepID=A0A087S6J2_9ARCH|nr:hypothetical protein AAA799N04_00900 [Marine Group I thaumarchaeote SCGC AAA799-N04]KER06137.1 hypothetical protein AAA799E16_01147 [Marine Group I thaumarchaeote SCGC AAA799-E16]KFM15873.1 hypothetical protein AAA799D11_01031 [Marine Group I thaumarchaeote SCGC AAA799-D11]KFM17438.1 hypothetical protein SCCGRSA3_01906 [Marine Group I thaumarchaeote SCGC RSA3]KFM21346.1 hypothetical protein AAA799B03_01121 [Marine Group I thaumarchaeote SCGC AAA799-B03]